MREQVRITENTEVTFELADVQDVDVDELSVVGDVVCEDGELVTCELKFDKLVDALTLYTSLQEQRYDWR